MGLRLAANLDRLWADQPVGRRFELAAAHGFELVELLDPRRHAPEVIDDAISRSGCRLVLFNSAAGRPDSGERGLLTLPGRQDEFQRRLVGDLEFATRWGVGHVHAVAGVPATDTLASRRISTAVENLLEVADRAQELGVIITVEFINQKDRPGFGLASLDDAAEVVITVDHPSVRLQFDQYHVVMSGLDPSDEYLRYRDIISYIQIAHAPGRHEPPTGSTALPGFLTALVEDGFAGPVSLEYTPRDSTEASLEWLDAWR